MDQREPATAHGKALVEMAHDLWPESEMQVHTFVCEIEAEAAAPTVEARLEKAVTDLEAALHRLLAEVPPVATAPALTRLLAKRSPLCSCWLCQSGSVQWLAALRGER